ncbi:hypothetical protein WDW86_09880 [Bdellovibrionota bacterium FG-2]
MKNHFSIFCTIAVFVVMGCATSGPKREFIDSSTHDDSPPEMGSVA